MKHSIAKRLLTSLLCVLLVAALATSLVQLLRFVLIFLSRNGGNRRD